MGRRTFMGAGGKPLPNRRNIIITSTPIEGIECVRSLPAALALCQGDVWICGGAKIYREGMALADVIDVTYVPDHVLPSIDNVYFPDIDERVFAAGPLLPHEEEAGLSRRIYQKRA
jgi:dihydrofolate reductase